MKKLILLVMLISGVASAQWGAAYRAGLGIPEVEIKQETNVNVTTIVQGKSATELDNVRMQNELLRLELESNPVYRFNQRVKFKDLVSYHDKNRVYYLDIVNSETSKKYKKRRALKKARYHNRELTKAKRNLNYWK